MKSRIKYKEDVDVGRTCLLKAFKNLYGKVFSIVIIQKKIRIMKLSEDIVGAKIKSSWLLPFCLVKYGGNKGGALSFWWGKQAFFGRIDHKSVDVESRK